MIELEQKILAEGDVLPGNILKVGSFLNQQLDVAFLLKKASSQALPLSKAPERRCSSRTFRYGYLVTT